MLIALIQYVNKTMLKQIFIFISLSAFYINISAQNVKAIFTPDTIQSCDTISISFNNLSIGPFDSLIWSFGDGDTSLQKKPTHLFDSIGIFTVRLTVFNTKKTPIDSSFTEQKIYIHGFPDAHFKHHLYGYPALKDTFFYSYKKYLFTATPYTNSQHHWWINNDMQGSDTSKMGTNFKTSGAFLIQHDIRVHHFLTDTISCYSKVEETINIQEEKIKIPNIFTPNGDGINDVFYIQTDGNTEYKLLIYNRHGNKVFLTEGKVISWDGVSYWGEKVSSGNYYYVLSSETDDIHKGIIFLNR